MMTGAEAMNRVAGKPPEPEGPGKTGRPRKQAPTLHLNPDDPLATSIATKGDDPLLWEAGSVLQILLPNGETRTLVLLNDAEVAPLDI